MVFLSSHFKNIYVSHHKVVSTNASSSIKMIIFILPFFVHKHLPCSTILSTKATVSLNSGRDGFFSTFKIKRPLGRKLFGEFSLGIHINPILIKILELISGRTLESG